MFKILKEKKELTVKEVLKKNCKNVLPTAEYDYLKSQSEIIDSCLNKNEKLSYLKDLFKYVSKETKKLDRIVEYGSYILDLKLGTRLVRRTYYQNKLRNSQREFYALLEFWKHLASTINCLEKELKNNSIECLNN